MPRTFLSFAGSVTTPWLVTVREVFMTADCRKTVIRNTAQVL
jgi:hypothetical protein